MLGPGVLPSPCGCISHCSPGAAAKPVNPVPSRRVSSAWRPTEAQRVSTYRVVKSGCTAARVQTTEFILVLLLINYCIAYLYYNSEPTFAHLCVHMYSLSRKSGQAPLPWEQTFPHRQPGPWLRAAPRSRACVLCCSPGHLPSQQGGRELGRGRGRS